MLIIFCSNPLDPKKVEEDFESEMEAATKAGFAVGLLDFDELVSTSNPRQALRRVRLNEDSCTGVYRGWMLSPANYVTLYEELKDKGVRLINDPQQYRRAHALPEYYELIEGQTAESLWLQPGENWDFDDLLKRLAIFDGSPVIIKDYVKSCKHDWFEACFIPDSSSIEHVRRVVTGFLERQGPELNGNLVFRRFCEFESMGIHPQSDLSLSREYRIFVFKGQVLGCFPYWSEVGYDDVPIPVEQFQPVVDRMDSNFFTMDIARTTDGKWMIVELGDGQVSGFPSMGAAQEVFAAIRSGLD